MKVLFCSIVLAQSQFILIVADGPLAYVVLCVYIAVGVLDQGARLCRGWNVRPPQTILRRSGFDIFIIINKIVNIDVIGPRSRPLTKVGAFTIAVHHAAVHTIQNLNRRLKLRR